MADLVGLGRFDDMALGLVAQCEVGISYFRWRLAETRLSNTLNIRITLLFEVLPREVTYP